MAGVEDDLGAAVVQAGVVPPDLPGLGPEEVLVATWRETENISTFSTNESSVI